MDEDRLSAFLTEACAGDPDLRRDVEELLAHRDAIPSVLRTAGAATFVDEPAADDPENVGPFRIVGRLGEGGMGAVYLAEQDEPIRRRVAIKWIKPGLDSRALIARFERERRTLARLQHPNIAQVYDAGTTELGRPYFVMEYVPGIAITRFCDLEGLAWRERLSLFANVCGAIHHAHQRGVIHRDIKPSNVLVTIVENEPLVKIIDFGIAKAVAGGLGDEGEFTVPGQIMGTPEYMSPEQASGGGDDLDVTTDVYSLGALLYELLVGVPPFDSATLRSGGFDEVRRRLREEEPPPPSGRAAERVRSGDAVPVPVRRLRGDLDWIVARALEKDRRRRYAAAAELRSEIERVLRGDPVLAGPPSATYRLGKLIRRHKVAFAGVAGVFAAMAIGLVVSTTLYVRAESARREADRQARRAERTNDFLTEMMRSADPEVGRRDMTVLEVLDRTAERIDGELADEPDVRAAAHSNLGNTYDALGRYDDAARELRAALDLHRELFPPGHREIGIVLNNLGLALLHGGHYDEAESALRESHSVLTTNGDDDPVTGDVCTNLAVLLKDLGRYDEAEPLYREALDVARRNDASGLGVAKCLSNLAILLRRQGRLEEAIAAQREAVEIDRRAGREGEASLAVTLGNLATALYGAGRDDEAEPMFREAIERKRAIYGGDHPLLARDLRSLAALLWRKGERAGAESTAVRALEMTRRVVGDRHPETATCLVVLSSMRTATGRPAEAEADCREALAIRTEQLPADHPDVVLARARLGQCLAAEGKREEAERELLAARAAAERTDAVPIARRRQILEWLEELYEDWRPASAESVRKEREALESR
ncbi:MAG: serine/threonine-protein kinase [bacterium]